MHDVEDRGTNKYGPTVVLCVEKLGEGERFLCVDPDIVNVCNEASKKNRLYSLQRKEAVTKRKYIL